MQKICLFALWTWYKNVCSSVMVCGLPVNWVTSSIYRYLTCYPLSQYPLPQSTTHWVKSWGAVLRARGGWVPRAPLTLSNTLLKIYTAVLLPLSCDGVVVLTQCFFEVSCLPCSSQPKWSAVVVCGLLVTIYSNFLGGITINRLCVLPN